MVRRARFDGRIGEANATKEAEDARHFEVMLPGGLLLAPRREYLASISTGSQLFGLAGDQANWSELHVLCATYRVPGAYEVITDEEMIEGLSFASFRRVATMIMVPAAPPRNSTMEMISINPVDLADAQRIDADAPHE